MTKTKAQEAVSSEEDTLLQGLRGETATETSSSMPYLSMNIASEDDDGNEIPVKTFHLSGTKLYSKTVRFRPYLYKNKLIAMKQDGKNWKTTNETLFYSGKEQPLDARGGIACGRLLGKAIPESWGEEQKKINKAKATYYGFLFGTVEFPGQEPVVCNLRVPAAKAFQVSNVMNDLDKAHGGYQKYMLNLKLISNPKDKSSPHPVLEIEPDLSTVLTSSGTGDNVNKIREFIESHNKRIRDSHKTTKLARQGHESDSALVDDVMEDDNDLNDTIPF